LATDSLKIWQDTLEKLQPSGTVLWATSYAAWVDERVTNKLQVAGGVSQSKFTFNKAVFILALQVLPPTPEATTGILNFAEAWEKAVLASAVVVPPGSFLGGPGSATTWSAAAAVIDPPSIAAGKAIIMTLISAATADSIKKSQFPDKFRKAFLALTVSITGTNQKGDGLASPFTPVK
jgi:hypothetical protein